jgi:hypothetical protein
MATEQFGLEDVQEGLIKVALTCTAHGNALWRWVRDGSVDLPDQGVHNPPPARILGLLEAEEAGVDLEDSSTWFPDPDWRDKYRRGDL